MADARLLHKKGSHGERIIALDHLEFRVWAQYVLSADDYGVMRASASVIRADNPRLEQEPFKRIVAAMAAIEATGLVQTFEHQGAKFWWQTDWQDFQGIRYPRATVNPAPSRELLQTATERTRKLFGVRPVQDRSDFGNVSEMPPTPARAGGRETLTLTANTNTSGSGSSEESARETKPTPLIDGRRMRQHGEHGWCSLPREGLCVPAFLHTEFIGKLGRSTAATELRAWYRATVDGFEGVAIGDDPIRFWRNQFAAWVGTVTSAPSNAGRKLSPAEITIQTANRG